MRISNMFQFTEHHRFCVYREFALSSLQMKMLTHMYQAMIGPLAVSLYTALYQQLSPDRMGYSTLEQQRKLFLALDLELNEKGRELLLEQTSRLEAVGLLQSFRKYLPQSDDSIFEYQLVGPLGPQEFFRNQHLVLLLRDKVGKYRLLSLREELLAPQPEELQDQAITCEALSIPFYERFRLNTHVLDLDMEQLGVAKGNPVEGQQHGEPAANSPFAHAEIMARFPRNSVNRLFVEQLRRQPEQLASVQFVAKKFRLSLQETCRLLDEDGMFSDDGELMLERLQYQANLVYRQGKKQAEQRTRTFARLSAETTDAVETQTAEHDATSDHAVQMEFYLEVPPVFHGQIDVHQYNWVLRNEPYTTVLGLFFAKGTVPDPLLDTFSKINLNYKLPEPVTNVLIHYLHIMNKSWSKAFIEAIAADLLARQVNTYEQAVDYVREQMAYRSAPQADPQKSVASGGRGKNQRPKMVVQYETAAPQQLSAEELDEIRKLAQKLDESKR
jgi:replication initiation and membrane attachment protein